MFMVIIVTVSANSLFSPSFHIFNLYILSLLFVVLCVVLSVDCECSLFSGLSCKRDLDLNETA